MQEHFYKRRREDTRVAHVALLHDVHGYFGVVLIMIVSTTLPDLGHNHIYRNLFVMGAIEQFGVIVGSLEDLISTQDAALSQRGGVLKVNERAESLGDSFL